MFDENTKPNNVRRRKNINNFKLYTEIFLKSKIKFNLDAFLHFQISCKKVY